MLIEIAISATGYILLNQSLARTSDEFAFPLHFHRQLDKINLILVTMLLLIPTSSALLWLFIGILLAFLKVFPIILRHFLLQELKKTLLPFFDAIILGLHSGRSFRNSAFEAAEMQTPWVQIQLRDLMQSIVKTERAISTKSALLKDLREEFIKIDNSKNRCLEQVKALRREYKMKEDFRRRSVQVTQQIRMQAIIVTALYAALLCFVIVQFGFSLHQNVILFSLFLFVAGLLWVFSIGRRLKWKV